MVVNNVFEAAHKGDFDYVREKLEENPKILLEVDSNKRMIIHWAVLSGNLKLVEYLIEFGAKISVEDDTDMTPLILASSAGHTEIVKLLLTKTNDVNHKSAQGHSSLQYAASKGWFEICQMLLENGADVNIIDERGSTPLHRAASKGNLAIVKLLIDDDELKINLKDIYGNTALHLSCEEDRQEVALLLVEHGADIEAKNKDNQTPLDLCTPKFARLLQNKSDKK